MIVLVLANVLAALLVLVASPEASAQSGKAVRIGVLRPAPDGPVFRQLFEPFRQVLRERGFVEGTNLTIDQPRKIPIERPIRFELVLNFKTAEALGLTISNSLLQRATHLIR